MAQVSAATDVPTLRRIALLANRVGEDDPTLRRATREISLVLDKIKRGVALGQSFDSSEIDRLRRLLGIVGRKGRSGSIGHAAILEELRDVARALEAD